jgi:hypothetical protein
MAVITLEITLEEGGEAKRYDLIAEKMPLTLLEGLEEKKFGMARRALVKFLKLPPEEAEALTFEHLSALMEAFTAATTVPNG